MKTRTVLLFLLLSSLVVSTARAADFDWRRYAGKTIGVWAADSGTYINQVRKAIPEFEKLTGIKVKLEVLDYTSFRNRQPLELIGRSTTYDVMQSMPVVEGVKFHNSGWYEDLGKYLSNSNLTSPDFDWADFWEAGRKGATFGKDIVTVPYEAQTLVLWYRKDLLEKAGLKVPKSFEELEKAAAELHKPNESVYGISVRGAGYQATTPFSAFLYGMGGSWLDAKGQPALDTPEAIKAFQLYGRLGAKYGPPGATGLNWSHILEFFQQGKLAMAIDINIFIPALENPEKSKVPGKVGYAVVPGGPAGPKPFFAGWGWMINPFAKQKEAGWYFIQYMNSKKIYLDLQALGHPSPRRSAWESPQALEADKKLHLRDVTMQSYRLAILEMNPPVEAGLEARQIIGAVTDLALTGAQPDQVARAAKEANQQLKTLLEKTRR